MKTFPTSAVWCLGILFISVSLITTGSSEVVGPADPVVALAGDDIILPCSLKPSVSAEEMVVEWTRSNLRKENVHLYRQGRDSNEDQSPSYSGRTSMFHEELKNGNVSLKLTRVTLSDAGRYRCFIPTLTSQVKETTVQLLVGAVSQPVISIDGTKGWGVVLKCESGGWFPEPEMEWLDSSGTILPADGPPEIHREEDLYAVRRHVTVNQTDTNRFTCRVKQPEINHLKETEIHVPDEVFPKSQVGFIVGLIAAAVVVLTASAGGVYWWRKHKEKQRQRLEELCDAWFVDRHKDDLIQRVSEGKSIASELHKKDLIPDEMNSQISAAGTRQDQMRLLFKALEEAENTTRVKSAFYRILLRLEPYLVYHLEEQRQRLEELRDAQFVTRHKDHLIQKVSKGESIASELHQKDLIPDEMNSRISAARTSQDQMRLLFKALEEAEDTTRVKSAFYRILLDLEPDLVKDLKKKQRQRLEERRDAWFVDRHKDHLIQKVSKGKSIASELHQKDLIPDEMNSQISVAATSQDQMRLLFKALEEAENTTRVKSAFYRILLDLEPDIVKDLEKQRQRLEELREALFVDRHKDDLIQKVSKGKSIASELHQKDLIPDEMNSQISAAGTSQDQMRLLFLALEEAENTTRVKSAFYRILLDLEPDIVKDLGLFNLFGK
ncbi:selection and upkeep of intraepithelial T-cells protein 5 isoform X2 [Salmo salar]|uniref:Selection and upkeep of intraepithelial T-cells protein 5 isoform X2 n=1 Tax=Salmo salar TaxID=8030 RepID=A0ABM3EAI1_SALSA|nr:selection and upkeep of intraepithelial T-cells protein 5-like isoform X2 [Salmo salar]